MKFNPRVAVVAVAALAVSGGAGLAVGNSTSSTGSADATLTAIATTSFPTAATTGVPSGATLTAYTGPTTITQCQTIDHKKITSALTIKVSNGNAASYTTEAAAKTAACVIFTDDLIIPTSCSSGCAGISTFYTSSTACKPGPCGPVFMADTEVSMPKSTSGSTFAVNETNVHCWRCNLHGTTQAAQCDGFCDFVDSVLTADRGDSPNTAHMDGFITNGNGANPISLVGDTIFCGSTSNPTDCSGDVGLFADFDTVTNVTISGSYMGCGAGCGNKVCWNFSPKASTISKLTLTNNVFDQTCSSGANLYAKANGVWCNNLYVDGSFQSKSLENCPTAPTTIASTTVPTTIATTTTAPPPTTTIPPTTTTRATTTTQATTTTTAAPVTTVPTTTTTEPSFPISGLCYPKRPTPVCVLSP